MVGPERHFWLSDWRALQPSATTVRDEGDRLIIETTPRRAQAILEVLAGATLQEVGDHLGLSRERIRQYLRDAGVTSAMRVQYRAPTEREQKTKRAWQQTGQRRRLIRERRTQWVVWIRAFVVAHQRAPTLRELAEAYYQHPVSLNTVGRLLPRLFLRRERYQRRLMRILRALYRCAGTTIRGRGSAGHVDPSAAGRAKWAAKTPEQRQAWTAALVAGRALARQQGSP